MIHKHIIQTRFDKHVEAIRKLLRSATLDSLADHKAFGLFVRVAHAEIEKLPKLISRGKHRLTGSNHTRNTRNAKIDFEKIALIDWTRRDTDIAKEFNVSRERIRQVRLMLAKDKVPKTKEDTLKLLEIDKELLVGKTREEVCEMFPGISSTHICNLLSRRGIKTKKTPSPLKALFWDLLNWDLSNYRLEDVWNLNFNAVARRRPHPAKWRGMRTYQDDPEFVEALAKEIEKADRYNAGRSKEEMETTKAKRLARVEKVKENIEKRNAATRTGRGRRKKGETSEHSLRGKVVRLLESGHLQETFVIRDIVDILKPQYYPVPAKFYYNISQYVRRLAKDGVVEIVSKGFTKGPGQKYATPAVYRVKKKEDPV